ncbi:MAG: hypothetical protein Q9168_002978 [Polycauliona sp. 1 TL-2023]
MLREPSVTLWVVSGLHRGQPQTSCGGRHGALHKAVVGRHTAVVEVLLRGGADLNEQCDTCGSSLEIAAAHGDLEMVKLLVQFGSNINRNGVQDVSAARSSSSHRHEDAVRNLLEQYDEPSPPSGQPYSSSPNVDTLDERERKRLRRAQPQKPDHRSTSLSQSFESPDHPSRSLDPETGNGESQSYGRKRSRGLVRSVTRGRPRSAKESHGDEYGHTQTNISEWSSGAYSHNKTNNDATLEYFPHSEGETINIEAFAKECETPTRPSMPLLPDHTAVGFYDPESRGINMLLEAYMMSQQEKQPTSRFETMASPTVFQNNDIVARYPAPEHLEGLPDLMFKGWFKCDFTGCCGQLFRTQELFDEHSESHSLVTQSRRHFCCIEGCPRSKGGKGFKRENEMIRHSRVHFPYFPNRGVEYLRREDLQRHVRVDHPVESSDEPVLREIPGQRLEHKANEVDFAENVQQEVIVGSTPKLYPVTFALPSLEDDAYGMLPPLKLHKDSD